MCKCGNRGCLELFTSRICLLRAIRGRAGGFGKTRLTADSGFAQVLDAYQARDELAVEEVHRVARYLAQGITNCINFANPDLVVIGDEYAGFGQMFLDRIKDHVKSAVLPSIYDAVKVELSQQSEDTVLRGAYLDVLAQTYLGSPREAPEGLVEYAAYET